MIRFIIGFLLVFAGVGGIENSPPNSNVVLFLQFSIAVLGLFLMYSFAKKY